MTTSNRNERPRVISAPLPPGAHARGEEQAGNDEQAQPADTGLLVGGHRDAAIVWRLRSDGDQVLLQRQPAHDVEEHVAVALEAEHPVRREVRVAEYRQPRLWLRRIVVGTV